MPLLSADSTSTILSKEEMSNATKVYDLNGYDILYSSDGKKLLKAQVNDWDFSIKNGTETICDGAIKLMASEYLGLISLNLRIPASVKKIGKGALTQKTILNNIEVDPNNNYFCSIDGNLYSKDKKTLFCYSDGKLNSEFTLPASVEKIKDDAFRGAYDLNVCLDRNAHLSTIYVASGNKHFKSIDGVLFSKDGKTLIRYPEGKRDLETYTIPVGVTEIAAHAFDGCHSLRNIIMPQSINYIGDYAFRNCRKVSNIEIPSNVGFIGKDAFGNCSSLCSIEVASGNINYYSIDGVLFSRQNTLLLYPIEKNLTEYTIPSGTTTIGKSAFRNARKLRQVNIPESVTTIESEAFCDCWSVVELVIPHSVTDIGKGAFRGCTSLETVVLPQYINKIEDYMFLDCYELVNYEIPPRVTQIGESAFIVPWKNIKLPDSLVYIGKEAFRGTYTQNLDIPSKVKAIGDGAFYGSNRLKSVRIPASVEFIGKEAFACCDSLEYFEVDSLNMNFCSIDGVLYSKDKKSLICYLAGKKDSVWNSIPSEVETIGYAAFEGCNNLHSINISQNVKEIGEKALKRCKIKNIILPSHLSSINDETFENCENLKDISIPAHVRFIGERAFMGCDKLAEIKIPSSVKYIKDDAFRNCVQLSNVCLSSGLKTIGNGVFCNCTNLKSILLPSKLKDIGTYAFYGCGIEEAQIKISK